MNYGFETTEYEIINKEMLTDGTVLFHLKGYLDFKPGQFVEVSLPHFGNVTLAPCSNSSDKKEFELCIHAQGSTSNAMIKLLPGDKISLRGPYGQGWPALNFSNGPTAKISRHNLTIITGGMGIVPLRPILLEMEKKVHFSNLTLFAGFKKTEDVLFESDLKRWKKKFKVHVSVETSSPKFWGERGLITKSLQTGSIDKQTTVFMCGPEIMYSHCIEILNEKGIGDKQIYLSLERRMECGIGLCQHCSCGSHLVCQDGPVFRLDKIKQELRIKN
ncbi:hypothetical protein COT78_00890 [Candidatus Berkelbacteria bacterium CG10_big_fil_rev_8_21_14_0_10_43_13]|uniref:FAD-binding FR-type domain-containing protein n=1 Tax=Candidatus Berkelbacteria bacterium CG10_big_fil_rev_8_21_14_0_10_43_13 TaxID=1974514 RepID=A0A2H0W781_9BACT|nr:MAG: hypothetical protein COT78_00890 [Candidatus Berkelbacteria bacterium CG10_big_fil_rev_8_21_14_0_10_43_13]